MVSSQLLRQIIKRHESFWDLSLVKKPLVGKIGPVRWKPAPYPIKGDRVLVEPCRISPEDIDVEKLTPRGTAKKLVVGDLILPLGCVYPEAWMEALIGCPIYACCHGFVAKPANINLTEASTTFSVIHMDRETGVWEKNKFLEYCKKIQEHSKCLIIKGELPEEELHEFRSTLSVRGLAICYQTP